VELLLMGAPMAFLVHAPRNLFFVACAAAVTLAARGRRVVLVSTDPASNLDEVLETALGSSPTAIAGAPGLQALNIDPEAAARDNRERVVGPYRGVLPDAAVRSIEEQLSGACTLEIAAFDEFSKLLADERTTAELDHVLFDTAPTGHTLRLLSLPAAWSGFLEDNAGGTSCLGPLAGLKAQRGPLRGLSRCAGRWLADRAGAGRPAALAEAERTRRELAELGIERQELVLNGIFRARSRSDSVAVAMDDRGRRAQGAMPAGLAGLPRMELPLCGFGLIGTARLSRLLAGTQGELTADAPAPVVASLVVESAQPALPPLSALLPALEAGWHGVIMTMGKGGVGKTSVAVSLAVALARRGHAVHLTTTDPAAHVAAALGASVCGLRVSRIDPAVEIREYTAEIMSTAGAGLDAAGRALLEEDLRSPCTEEIAVFRALAKVVEEDERGFVVIDTAPTGHTILLLDAVQAYHRDVLRAAGTAPEEVRRLLPRLRDPVFTKILLVTLPEATPVHEAAALQRDLERAGITPFGWVVNQSLWPLRLTDPTLVQRRASELRFHDEVRALASRVGLVPWSIAAPGERLDLVGPDPGGTVSAASSLGASASGAISATAVEPRP
jgi:arsenite-transporting ATPase